jgi:hypothetical protein
MQVVEVSLQTNRELPAGKSKEDAKASVIVMR